MGLLAKGRVALQKGIVFRENLARNQGWCTISLAFSTLVARDLTFLPILDKMNTLFSVEQSVLCSGGKQQICGYGGIGRRARFRFWWQQPCRFKSCHPHQCRNGLRSIQKARLRPGFSHTTPSFLLLRKKSRLARLLSCKRTLTTARCRCQLFAGTWVQIFLKKTEFFCLTFTHLL